MANHIPESAIGWWFQYWYDQGVADTVDRDREERKRYQAMIAGQRQRIEQLERMIVDQMASTAKPIYLIPPPAKPTVSVSYLAHRDLEDRVARMEERERQAKVPYVFAEKLEALQRQVNRVKDDIGYVVQGAKATSDRVTNLTNRVDTHAVILTGQR